MYLKPSIKYLLSRIAAITTVRKVLDKRYSGIATVFVLHRAAKIYRGIRGHDTKDLEDILLELKNAKLNLVALKDVVAAAQGGGALPPRSVAFTMDDGYRDQLDVLAPIFVKHKVPLTVFLSTGLLDGDLWPWDAKIHWLMLQTMQKYLEVVLGRQVFSWQTDTPEKRMTARRELQTIASSLFSDQMDKFIMALQDATGVKIPETPPEEFLPASWDQVRDLQHKGVEFAPHTHRHRILSRISDVDMRSEMSKSQERIKAEISGGIKALAYPVGMEPHFGRREMLVAEELGFLAAFAVCGEYSKWREARDVPELRYCLTRFALPEKISDSVWIASCLEDLISRTVDSLIEKFKIKQIGKREFIVDSIRKIELCLGRYCNLKHIDVAKVKRYIFVCRGNICRSPYAEKAALNLGIPSLSCGVEVCNPAPADKIASLIALVNGKDITNHMSKSIFDLDIKKTDCLVAMDPTNLVTVKEISDRVGCQITLLGMWCNSPTLEIKDPFGRTATEFLKCFSKIDESVKNIYLQSRIYFE